MSQPSVRDIIYVSTDDFYASVTRLRDPTLRSRPVIIGQLSNRGFVLAASYEARADGVRAGLTMPQARRLCPRAAFVQIDWPLFKRASDALFSLLGRYSPLVEAVSLDEGFMDYTGCTGLFGEARDLAWKVQKELAGAVRLSASLGLAGNKLTSQVASKAAKRGGLVVVPAGGERAFLGAFPVSWLPGVRASHWKTLSMLGIRTIGSLSQVPPFLAECVLGSFGRTLVERAGGIDNRPVRLGKREALIEESVTFRDDLVDLARIDPQLYALSETLGRTLRRQGLGARGVRLRLSYTDGCEVTRGARLGEVTHSDRLFYKNAVFLLKRAYTRRVKVRALHLGAVRPVPLSGQMDLFPSENSTLDRLYQACDAIREKYPGKKVLCFGRTFGLGENDEALSLTTP